MSRVRFSPLRSKSARRWLLLTLPLLVGLGLLRSFSVQRPKEVKGGNGFGNLGGRPTAIAFSPDGKTLVCATDNNYVQVWRPDIERWHSFRSDGPWSSGYGAGTQRILRLRFSPDGQTLYSGGVLLDAGNVGNSNGVMSAWNVRTRRMRFTFGFLNGCAFDVSRDDRLAATGFFDYTDSGTSPTGNSTYAGSVELHQLRAKPAPTPTPQGSYNFTPPRTDWRLLRKRELKPRNGNIISVALSPDGQTLAIGTDAANNAISLWDTNRAQRLSAPNLPTFSPVFLEWSPDGTRLACLSDTELAIYDRKSGTFRQVVVANSSATTTTPTNLGATTPANLAWTPDGNFVFSGGDRVQMWRASDLTLQRTFGVSGPVAVSPDGKTLATAKNPAPNEPNGLLMWPLS